MNVPAWLWVSAIAAMVAVLAVDLVAVVRNPREPSMRESALWAGFYVAVAVAFGGGILAAYGGEYGGQFISGWLTEYALSVDNLFVYMLIMTRFAVRREHRQRMLLIGVVITLGLRIPLILAGSAVVERFGWVFYLFGVFLVYTAIKLLVDGGAEQADDATEGRGIRLMRRLLPISDEYNGARLTVKQGNRVRFTPLMIVVCALGVAGVIFAFDSIPAIFGLTSEPFLIITANLLALMGLRQLYFLIGGLMDRLAHLSYGLAAILVFIGANLVLEALHDNTVPFINGGEPVSWAPDLPVWVSLSVIVGALAVTALVSLTLGNPVVRSAARSTPPTPRAEAATAPAWWRDR
jgi:tellurite resistance protein TerC